MNEPTGELSFERAEYEGRPQAAACCQACASPLSGEYYKWQAQLLCARCKDSVADTLLRAQSPRMLGKAVLLGGAVALGCGIAYAVFVALTGYQLALVTIGIAYVVAKVVRRASSGLSGRKFQILAVAFTYGASSLGYFPAVWKAVTSESRDGPAVHAAAASASTDPAPGSVVARGDRAAAPSDKPEKAPSAGGLVVALAFLFALVMAAPVLAAKEAPFGLLIVAIGLWEAWRLSRPVPVAVEGPYRLAPSGPVPPGS
jgi:ribose/xylose/arabinose/galactoside ABC-type transport system permease subunit